MRRAEVCGKTQYRGVEKFVITTVVKRVAASIASMWPGLLKNRKDYRYRVLRKYTLRNGMSLLLGGLQKNGKIYC